MGAQQWPTLRTAWAARPGSGARMRHSSSPSDGLRWTRHRMRTRTLSSMPVPVSASRGHPSRPPAHHRHVKRIAVPRGTTMDELMSEGRLEEALALVAVCTVDLFLQLSAGVLRRRFFFASYCIGCTDKAPSVKIRCRKLTAWYVQRPE